MGDKSYSGKETEENHDDEKGKECKGIDLTKPNPENSDNEYYDEGAAENFYDEKEEKYFVDSQEESQ